MTTIPTSPPNSQPGAVQSLPKPYYDDGDVQIYHGDCRDILPLLPKVDLVLTDPPYLSMAGGTIHKSSSKALAPRLQNRLTVGNPWDASLDWIDSAWEICDLGIMVFCTYHFIDAVVMALPEAKRVALFTWVKPNAPNPVQMVPKYDCEYIWALQKHPGLNWKVFTSTVMNYKKLSAGCVASPERLLNKDLTAFHPTQKPLAVMSWLLSAGGQLILDPFMGVGTTLLAAKNLSRKAIGIEIEEKYCEAAAKRMGQGVLL
jgi:site-specific DNA-methyltransferase (adenine-specific)